MLPDPATGGRSLNPTPVPHSGTGMEPCTAVMVERPLLPRNKTFLRMFDLAMVENWVRHQG